MALFGTKPSTKEDKKPAAKTATKKTVAKKEPVKKEAATSMQDLYNEPKTAKVVAKAGKAVTGATTKINNAYRVLVRPLITEKATNLGAQDKYVFVVSRAANKIEVAKAVQAAYGVKPLRVNLVNVMGKKVSRGKVRGQRSDWRKAIVTLAKGETIKIYEGV